MSRINLAEKFPQMKPIKSPPALWRINGCGVALYGARDRDPETGAYVATWCISLLFLPTFCLRAYRVAKAESGWYFLGREPLSPLARLWNVILLLAIAGIFGGVQYSIYTSSPAYKAQQQMAAAQAHVKNGQLSQAARIYQTLAIANRDQSAEASQALTALLDNQCQQASLSESAGVYVCAAKVSRKGQNLSTSDVAAKALALVNDKGDSDPRAAIAILDAVHPLVVDTRPIDARRLPLLQKLAAREPNNLEVIVPLASLLEEQNKLDEAKKLLLPLKDKLGEGEGAKVLGTIFDREEKYDDAYALLWPYVKTRLDTLHSAEKAATDTAERVSQREFDLLKHDKAPADFYEKYNAAAADEQHAMVQRYLDDKLKNDPEYAATQEALVHEAAVVPVALELGIVMLQRAQAQTDTAVRKTQLEATEKVFLAVGGVAGEDDRYRLSLGQVYYWLGKQAQGRKLFEDYLAANGRGFQNLLNVAFRLRQLGAIPEARSTAEEAYTKSGKREEQQGAAFFRSMLYKDTDDQIAWLNKSDTSDPTIKAELAEATGDKSFEEGHDDEAVRQYHIAIDAYNAMPRSATTLNETAIAYYDVFRANGDHQSLDRSLDYFQQAVDLKPQDTVLLSNAGEVILRGAIADVIGSDIDLRALHETGDLSLLGYLYRDQAARDAMAKKVREHPGVIRALSYLEKVVVLSPKNVGSYSAIYGLHHLARNDAALRTLEQRLQAADLDTSDHLTAFKELLSGAKDQQNQTTLAASLKRTTDLATALRPKGGRTAAVAICNQIATMMALDLYNTPADPAKILALAEEAHGFSPSASTSGIVASAHYFKAYKELRKNNPAFEAYCKKCERSVNFVNLLTLAGSEPGPLQQDVLKHPDLQKAIAITKEQTALFTDKNSPQDWALLKQVDAGEAEQMAKFIRNSPRALIEQSIAEKLSPVSANQALETYWFMQIMGKPQEGRAALRRVAAMGIPLPIEP